MTDYSLTTTVNISRFVRLKTVHLIASQFIYKSIEVLTRVISGIRSDRLEVLSLRCDIYVPFQQGVHDPHVITGLEELDGTLVLPQFNSLRHVRLFLRCFQSHSAPTFSSGPSFASRAPGMPVAASTSTCEFKAIFPPQKAPDNDMFVFGHEARHRRRSVGTDHLPQVSILNIAGKNMPDDNASPSNATQLFGIPAHRYAGSSHRLQDVQHHQHSHSFQQFVGAPKGDVHRPLMLPQIQRKPQAPSQLQHPGYGTRYGARSVFGSPILGHFPERTSSPAGRIPVETNSLDAANIGASESVFPSRVYEHSAGRTQSPRPLGSAPTLQAPMQSTDAFESGLPQQIRISQLGRALAYPHSWEPSFTSADRLTQVTQSSQTTSTRKRRRIANNNEPTHMQSAPAPSLLRSTMSSAMTRSTERPPLSQWQTVHESQERSTLRTLPPARGPVFESGTYIRPRVRQITGPYMRSPSTLAEHLHAAVRKRMKRVAARGILTVEVEVVGQ